MASNSVLRKQRERLEKEIKKISSQSPVDVQRLVELTSELSSMDESILRFRVDAGVISRLGRELVASQETALSELIKNAYDADASRVELIFDDADEPGGSLSIEDNGSGMTREELISGFMTLASTQKVDAPFSPKWKRKRAGQKGIGRFASQRLGSRLLINTKTAKSKKAYEVDIDWDDFLPGKNLEFVASKIREISSDGKSGTTLTIINLRDSWPDSRQKKAYRSVMNLQDPIEQALLKDSKKTKKDQDPGFCVTIKKTSSESDEEDFDLFSMVYKHAHAEITASVDGEGRSKWRVVSERLGVDDSEPGETYGFLKNIKLKAYYFVWVHGEIPTQDMSRIKSLSNEYGGVRLYRNGFRVPPYGDLNDDWLGLDELYRGRTFLAAIGNQNFFGAITIGDDPERNFEETSSREGLIHSFAFDELTGFGLDALVNGVARVQAARGKKVHARDPKSDKKPEPRETTERALGAALSELREVTKAGKPNKKTELAQKKVEEKYSSVVEEISMLRVLASVGLSVGVFSHEIRNSLIPIEHGLNLLPSDGKDSERKQESLKYLELVKQYSTFVENSAELEVGRDLDPVDVSSQLYEFAENAANLVKSRGISIETDIDEELRSIPMHSGELISILANLLSNSIKAIRRSEHHGDGCVFIKAYCEDGFIYIEFMDNGDGIADEVKDRVFDAFFTTTRIKKSHGSDELRSMGLGLKIVSDISSARGGEVFVGMPDSKYVTSIVVKIPSSESE
ncbi:sensor histidine kinase [Pelagicoccus sp. SDUM812002]|uniref:sensor histidine kinase n=1 Tax=Pelagicoccus sp. SDUM812002 TaxID=3041266 RepID=UPI00280D9B02|nr:sensor histidine kinase [Pelagicoccus sp. SDUM812002]MDQ8183955.1 sensor histidine kinase [Pelagicoccus sp. SDUM812002]